MADGNSINTGKASSKSADSSASATELPAGPAKRETKLPAVSAAELKKIAKEEKAARRAAQKQGPVSIDTDSTPHDESLDENANRSQTKDKSQSQQDSKHQRTSSKPTIAKPTSKEMPSRRRLSHSTPIVPTLPPMKEVKPVDLKQVSFFTHLYNQQQRRGTLEGTSKDVHPAILTLALQTSSYIICGGHARCVSMLLALKEVISSYTTPPGTALPRHLSTHALSPQLAHLKSHGRPFSTSQSNSIRWLKNIIAKLDPSLPESTAKQHLQMSIDTFIRERFTIADHVIAEAVVEDYISDNETILVYAKSAVVTEALTLAIRRGRQFHIIIVDSKVLFEGQALLRSLKQVIQSTDAQDRIHLSYCQLTGLAAVLAIHEPTVCILGAHAILNDGQVYSRAGTALVALLARQRLPKVPILVCVESIKFTERVALDSIVVNELAPEHELFGKQADLALQNWHEMENLFLLNPLYDMTPTSLVSMLVTELGSVPPSAAPVVQRMTGGAGEGTIL